MNHFGKADGKSVSLNGEQSQPPQQTKRIAADSIRTLQYKQLWDRNVTIALHAGSTTHRLKAFALILHECLRILRREG